MSKLRTAHLDRSLYPRPDLAGDVIHALWSVVRIPIFAVLVVLEPLVSFVLTGLALLGLLTTFLFKLTGADPRFPFWGMLGASTGFAVALMGYHALIRLLSR